MKNKHVLLAIALLLSLTTFAQQEKKTREEKDEQNQARTARMANKTDVALFRRQLLALKEYADERKKIPALQKANKGVVIKVSVAVDTADLTDDATTKTLNGYIKQDIGDVSNNTYEAIFDRSLKKITSLKKTGDGEEVEKADAPEKADPKKTDAKKATVHKKNKDDDDDDEEDDKPAKKEKDDDN